MIFIYESQHSTFLKCLDEAIQKLERDDAGSGNTDLSVPELKEDVAGLTAIYLEYHHSIAQLRLLVNQYSQVQKKARVRLRMIQLANFRQLRTGSDKTSFTKTHKPIL